MMLVYGAGLMEETGTLHPGQQAGLICTLIFLLCTYEVPLQILLLLHGSYTFIL